MVVSVFSLVVSIVLMIVFAIRRGDGIHMAYAHMGMAALVAVGFAASFFKANTALREAGASQSAVAANTSRFVGYVWGWGAACLLTTYATGILAWREWLHFSVAALVLSAASLIFATMLQRDADSGREDQALLKLGHTMAIIMLVAMIAAIVGFLIDGKMVRFLNPRFTDWAANNVFFFGAVSLAAITGYALKYKQRH